MYFDPGVGSMIIQAILAVIATIGVAWGIVKIKVKGLLVKNPKENQAENHNEQL